MKSELIKLFDQAARQLIDDGRIRSIPIPEPQVTIPKERKFGDYATNLAMILGKKAGMPPREMAALLVEQIGDGGGMVLRCEIAGPGFVNVFVDQAGMFRILRRIEQEGDRFGRSDVGRKTRIQVEFVSANPTGPLHVGHGRNAIYGDTLARLLDAAGYEVQKEYYVNDAGLQIATLGRSTFLRYRQLLGDDVTMPEGHYVGDYLIDVATSLRAERGDDLTEQDIPQIALFAADKILNSIRSDLETVGVTFDNWFSEKSLHNENRIDQTLQWLQEKKLAYEKDGALWFATEQYGDDKDRVLVKSDGEKTYFAADVAYHADKYERGFDQVINVWGADHHGYIPRMKAAVQALGRTPDDLDILLIQLVTLTRKGEVQQMSTRAGAFVTLAELGREVGSDALRYFYLMRRHDAQLEFDIDLAREQTNKNPVFYVQYMHARICSIFAKAEQEKLAQPRFDDVDVAKLEVAEEKELVRHLAEFPQVVVRAAQHREPHWLIGYLYELANQFHYYYHQNRVICDDVDLTAARLLLCRAARQVLQNGLAMAGIGAPKTM